MYPTLTARLASVFRPDYTPGSPAPPAPRDADSGLASCTSPQGTTHWAWLAACNWQPGGVCSTLSHGAKRCQFEGAWLAPPSRSLLGGQCRPGSNVGRKLCVSDLQPVPSCTDFLRGLIFCFCHIPSIVPSHHLHSLLLVSCDSLPLAASCISSLVASHTAVLSSCVQW